MFFSLVQFHIFTVFLMICWERHYSSDFLFDFYSIFVKFHPFLKVELVCFSLVQFHSFPNDLLGETLLFCQRRHPKRSRLPFKGGQNNKRKRHFNRKNEYFGLCYIYKKNCAIFVTDNENVSDFLNVDQRQTTSARFTSQLHNKSLYNYDIIWLYNFIIMKIYSFFKNIIMKIYSYWII